MNKREHDNNEGEDDPSKRRKKCPYLDTINPQLLDFDFEKVCSISLSHHNIYACLVCGKYFQGRGPATHAFTHSVQMGHHVFIHLKNERIFCLPDNYQVVDTSLLSIQRALTPRFMPSDLISLDTNRQLSTDVFGVPYLPGFIGLNNLSKTDYVNVILQALAHVPMLRNYFLTQHNVISNNVNDDTNNTCKSEVVIRFGELIRKMWSPNNSKNTISPHEVLQEISVKSAKKFAIGTQNDSLEFLNWFLNELHTGLNGTRKKGSSIVHKAFQGIVEVVTQSDMGGNGRDESSDEKITAQDCPFLLLTLELPETPLFKDTQGGNVIPQIPLYDVLCKFNGEKVTHGLKGSIRQRKKYILRKLPQYLIFHVARFTKNNFFMEKNPTIVTFPIKNLEMEDFTEMIKPSLPTREELQAMSISKLQSMLKKHLLSATGCIDKNDLVNKVYTDVVLVTAQACSTKYDLIANICHDSSTHQAEGATTNANPLTEGSYRVHVQNKATDQWYEIQDLHVQETMPQLISQSESYIMIYERRIDAE